MGYCRGRLGIIAVGGAMSLLAVLRCEEETIHGPGIEVHSRPRVASLGHGHRYCHWAQEQRRVAVDGGPRRQKRGHCRGRRRFTLRGTARRPPIPSSLSSKNGTESGPRVWRGVLDGLVDPASVSDSGTRCHFSAMFSSRYTLVRICEFEVPQSDWSGDIQVSPILGRQCRRPCYPRRHCCRPGFITEPVASNARLGIHKSGLFALIVP